MAGKKSTPSEYDIRIGQIIAISRRRMGMSQKDLAKHLNVTFQQVQKYETGGNRIYMGTLIQIANVFEMTAGQLLDGMSQTYAHDRDITEVIKLMYKMNREQRKLIMELAQSIIAAK